MTHSKAHPDPPDRYFTFDQAVTYFKEELGLEVTKTFLYKQSSLGRIPFFPMGRRKVCTERDLLNFVENQRTRTQHQADQQNRPQTSQRKPYERRAVDPDIRLAVTGK